MLDLLDAPRSVASSIPERQAQQGDFDSCCVFGLRLACFSRQQALDAVETLVVRGRPAYFITANLNYAMLSSRDAGLRAVNDNAAFLLADGMPLVWASRSHENSLPERVTGADLLPAICERAAAKGHRIFFLGAEPGVAAEAARRLEQKYPGLVISGTASPKLSEMTTVDETALVAQIRDSRTDILFVAFGQPIGEMWLAKHYLDIQAVCVQVGASIDFAAGHVARAPRWIQAVWLEWAYRIVRDPRRLAGRYLRNALFLAGSILKDIGRVSAGAE